ncbi:MAG: hypothetical protein HY017_13730 [Betaproteobacteria bacterium]|nr:hypothetical protein [Betaproteobacteria bacterium]
MIAEIKPYPVMRDSGVPWLGEVPAHWEVLPALAAYKPKLVRNTGMVEKTVLSLTRLSQLAVDFERNRLGA